MTRVLAIDPGDTESAYALIDAATRRPLEAAKLANDVIRTIVHDIDPTTLIAVEMIASYGMPVGREVFETCVWVGRFVECAPCDVELVYRRDVKLHHCYSARATDANVRQALIDRFAHGQPNGGKGSKGAPGVFFGFKADIYQAFALAVHVADRIAGTR